MGERKVQLSEFLMPDLWEAEAKVFVDEMDEKRLSHCEDAGVTMMQLKR